MSYVVEEMWVVGRKGQDLTDLSGDLSNGVETQEGGLREVCAQGRRRRKGSGPVRTDGGLGTQGEGGFRRKASQNWERAVGGSIRSIG